MSITFGLGAGFSPSPVSEASVLNQLLCLADGLLVNWLRKSCGVLMSTGGADINMHIACEFN